jgi:hypothetical protein
MLESSNMGPIGMARKGMGYIFVILILLKFLNYTLKCLAIIWTNIESGRVRKFLKPEQNISFK